MFGNLVLQSVNQANGRNDVNQLVIRPIAPSDAPALQAGFESLSEMSRYYRFHSGIRRLSDGLLRYLTEVDEIDHVALVAFERRGSGICDGVAVGRFVRNREAPHTAEIAVTVVDRAQGRGIARQLLAALGDAARERGIDTFTMSVISGNTKARRLVRSLGAIGKGSAGEVAVFHLPVTALARAA